MRIRVPDDTTDAQAAAISEAMASHYQDDITVVLASGDEVGSASYDGNTGTDAMLGTEPEFDDDLGPTKREDRLREQIAEIHEGGPKKYKDDLPNEGKLFVRDRIELWFGEDGFLFEDGTFAEYDAEDELAADGLITGAAEFEGRDVHFMSNDYTVKRGSMAAKGVEKYLRMQQRALKTGRPILYLMDSAGGRIDQQTGFFANREGIGKYYYNHSMLSGRVPQICVLYAPSIAGAAYTPVFNDFTIMVRDISAMAIASPRMVEMATGEKISMQNLGGPDVHTKHSGSADLIAEDEEHARELVAQLISYLPDNCDEKPPQTAGKAPELSPAGIDSVVPQKPNKSYDMKSVIFRVIDANSWFEIQPDYGKEMLTGFARIDGRPIGIIANQPKQRAGAIFPDAAEKAAEFIWKCDAFNIPLLSVLPNLSLWLSDFVPILAAQYLV